MLRSSWLITVQRTPASWIWWTFRGRDRALLVGDFKPGGDAALDRFRDLVRGAYTILYTSKAWGQPLRDAHWATLPVPVRLLSELRRWNRLGGEPFHRIYWYAARCREWAVTLLRLPGLKVLASLPCDDTRDPCIASLLPIASVILVREIDVFSNAMVMVGMPPDFAVFDESLRFRFCRYSL